MKFTYHVELKSGYKRTMEMSLNNDVKINFEAPNRVTADRIIRALLINAPNVERYTAIDAEYTEDELKELDCLII